MIDLVTPVTPGTGRRDVLAARSTDPLFSGDGYLVLDMLGVASEDLREANAAALLAGLENPLQERIPSQLAALRARLDGAEFASLRELMLRWAQQTVKRRVNLDLGIGDMAELDRMHESDEVEEYFAARVRAWQDQYRTEGLERGLAAERDLLCRLASRKFDAGTAERLAGLLARVGDTDRLAEVGEWIIDCATGNDLIARFGNGAVPGS